MLCVLAHLTGPLLPPAPPASSAAAPGHLAATACYRSLGWPVIADHDQVALSPHHSVVLMMPNALAREATTILTTRGCASSHPETCCGLPLNWHPDAVQVCWQESGPPCGTCLSAANRTP